RLYNKILVNNFKRYKSIRVISGYASPTMVRRVIKSFPDVHILLYIGMTQEGISEQNHQDYLQITASYPNIQIYYQYKGSLNHIKLIEFYNDTDCKVYVGSANFTENGYLNQKELKIGRASCREQGEMQGEATVQMLNVTQQMLDRGETN